MSTGSARHGLSLALLASLLLVLVLLPNASSASPSLRRHSPDFQQRIFSYGDVWTRQEVATLTGLLESLKQHGLAYTLEVLLPANRAALEGLLKKLSLLDERLSRALGSLLGLTRDVPADLLARVSSVLPPDRNASLLIRAVNSLYVAGELSSVDYLLLMGYIANEFKAGYIEDPETLANIRRATAEVASSMGSLSPPPLPEPEQRGAPVRSSLLVRAPELPPLALALTLSMLLAPLATRATLALIARARRSGSEFMRRALLARGTIASVLATPEDVVSAYWAAVEIMSRAIPRDPWDTHREYLAKVERELGREGALAAFRTLSEEYEAVRFAGRGGSLNREQLAELLERIEKELRV